MQFIARPRVAAVFVGTLLAAAALATTGSSPFAADRTATSPSTNAAPVKAPETSTIGTGPATVSATVLAADLAKLERVLRKFEAERLRGRTSALRVGFRGGPAARSLSSRWTKPKIGFHETRLPASQPRNRVKPGEIPPRAHPPSEVPTKLQIKPLEKGARP